MISTQAAQATFIVLAEGRLGAEIASLAEEHAQFAPERRRVLTRDQWPHRLAAAERIEAVVVSTAGVVCAMLDARQGLSAAWIEDAFIRGRRSAAP